MLQTNVENSELKTLVSYTRVKSKSYIITYTFKIASKALKSAINKKKMYLIQFYLINLAICEKKITFAAEVCLCKP